MYRVLLHSGRDALITAGNTATPIQIGSFDVGLQGGFLPDPAGSEVVPSTLLTISNSKIFHTIVTEHEIIITALLDHNIATHIGNVMLRLTDDTPFAWFVMPANYRKSQTDSSRPYAGEKYFFHFLLDFPNLTSLLDVSNLQPFYVEMLYRNDFDSMDWPPQTATYEQYITAHKGRLVLAHRIEDRWWGMPFAQTLDDVRFFQIDGGEDGDGYFYTPLMPEPTMLNADFDFSDQENIIMGAM